MKKLIVLALVLGIVASAQAVVEDFTYPDQSLTSAGIGNVTDFSDTGADPEPGDTRAPWQADIVSNQLQWYGFDEGNADVRWVESIDIVAAPIQTLSMDFRFDENAYGWTRNRIMLFHGSNYDARSGIEIDSYPQIEVLGTGTRQYLTGEVPLDLGVWYTAEMELNYTAGTFKARIGETGGTMSDWTADVLMKSAAQYSNVWLSNNGLATIDNLTLTPEPATIALLGMGALALIRKKKLSVCN